MGDEPGFIANLLDKCKVAEAGPHGLQLSSPARV